MIAIFGEAPSQTRWEELARGCRTLQDAEVVAANSACTGATGRILDDLAGCATRNFLRFNLNARWLPRFDDVEAAITASIILMEHPDIERVVCLGRKVGTIMGFGRTATFLTTRRRNDRTYLLFPHPSGLNRWFNDPSNRRLASDALRAFLRRS